MMLARDRRAGDEGYALIAALWLLLLAASLAGLLMLRAVQGSKSVSFERAALIRSAGEESALETAAADLLINGTSSRFGRLPSTAIYRIGGQDYEVEASRESERLDINDAPLTLIDAELRMTNIEPAARSTLVTTLDRNRRTGDRIETLAEANVLLPDAPCMVAALTPYQGRTAAASAGVGAGSVAAAGGAGALRLRMGGPGATRTVIVRPGLAGQTPVQVLETKRLQGC